MPNNEMWHAHDDILSSHDKLMDAMADEHQNQKTSEGRMSNVDDLEFLYIDPDGKIVDTVDPVVSLTETDTSVVVNNGYNTYTFSKLGGYSCRTRSMWVRNDDG